MNQRPSLVIAILTYRRTDLLGELLAALPAQIADAADLVDARVLVVDNDAQASAREVSQAAPGVRYVVEATPGIAAGRYRCLEEAADDDLLQFIDDDELPEPGWLRYTVQAWLDHDRPAAVAGSVLPRYMNDPDPWIVAGGFFVRRRPATGTVLPAAPTGNLLLDMQQVRKLGVQFDRGLGLHGGSDTVFTKELVSRGGRIIFCRESAISDLVPADRATREWVLQRARHHGAAATRLELSRAQGLRGRLLVRARRLAGGAARMVVGQGRGLLGLVARRQDWNAKGLRLRQRGLGMAHAALGTVPEAYGR